MTQEHVHEHYTALIDGSLPEPLRQQVEAHLQRCPQCASGLEEMRGLITELRSLPELAPPAGLAAGVRARLQAESPRRPLFWRVPALAGGLATAAVAALMMIMLHGNPAMVPTGHNDGTKIAQKALPENETPQTGTTRGLDKAPSTTAEGGSKLQVAKENHREQHARTGISHDEKTLIAGLPRDVQAREDLKSKVAQGTDETPFRSRRDRSAGWDYVKDSKPSTAGNNKYDENRQLLLDGNPKPMVAKGGEGGTANGLSSDDRKSESPVAELPAGAAAGGVPAAVAPSTVVKPTPTEQQVNVPESTASAYGRNSAGPRAMGAMAMRAAATPTTLDLAVGKVDVSAQSLPGSADGVVQLRMDKDAAITALSVRSMDANEEKEQSVFFAADTREARVLIPARKEGAALKLSFHSNARTDALYLIAPGTAARQATLSLRVAAQPAYRPFMQMATASGAYFFCPVELAEGKTSFTTENVKPLTALNELLKLQGYQTEQQGEIVNITPTKK